MLGAGGAAQAVAAALLDAGARSLAVAARRPEAAEALAARLRGLGADAEVRAAPWPPDAAAGIVVNATPLRDEVPLDARRRPRRRRSRLSPRRASDRARRGGPRCRVRDGRRRPRGARPPGRRVVRALDGDRGARRRDARGPPSSLVERSEIASCYRLTRVVASDASRNHLIERRLRPPQGESHEAAAHIFDRCQRGCASRKRPSRPRIRSEMTCPSGETRCGSAWQCRWRGDAHEMESRSVRACRSRCGALAGLGAGHIQCRSGAARRYRGGDGYRSRSARLCEPRDV